MVGGQIERRLEMKKTEVQAGKTYIVRVSGSLVPVRIIGESAFGGWDGTNLKTGRRIRIRTAGKLRGEWNHKNLVREWNKLLSW